MDATSGEQERRAKPRAVCSEQSRAKEKGKRPKTRERQYKKRATSVAGTADSTASRRKSWRERTRLPRAGEPGHPGNPGLSAQRASTAQSAMHNIGETLPRKHLQEDSHQSSQEGTLQNTQECGLQEETKERDRETERFRYSLTYSRVSGARPGWTEYGPGKEEEGAQ